MHVLRHMIQAGVLLSMMRLSNPVETETFLHLPAHQNQVDVLRALLKWRGFTAEKCLMLFGITGSQRMATSARRMMLDMTHQHHGLWLGEVVGRQWAKTRFRSAYLRDTLWEHGYAVESLETAVPWHSVHKASQVILRALREAVSPVLPMVHLSHVYRDGASLYFTFLFRVGATFEETVDCWRALKEAGCKAVLSVGGTISHQHGVGADHLHYLAAEKGELGMQLLKNVQEFLDPSGMMNPGKLI